VTAHEAEAGTGSSNDRRLVFADFEVNLQRGSLARGGEEIDQRTMIRTVPRRGLIFEVPVQIEGAAAPPAPKIPLTAVRHGWKLAAGIAAMAVLVTWWAAGRRPAEAPPEAPEPATPSIVVLRFTDLSPAGDNAWLADGLAEEIMHRLAQSPSLRVIARVSSFAVEDLAAAEIAEKLDVSHVLEGSLRRQGDAIRVTAQLIDAATETHLWSRAYDRKVDDIIGLQEEIAVAVADSLHASLSAPVDEADIDPGAYARFLEARYFYLRRAEGDLEKAEARLEEAVAISPEFARAWAYLSLIARVRLWRARYQGDPPGDIASLHERQQHAAEQALRYGQGLPLVHISAASYYNSVGERHRAAEQFEIARSLDPDHYRVLNALSNAALHAGRLDESLCLNRRIVTRDPLNLAFRDFVVQHLIWAGRLEEAQAELDRVLELAPSSTGRNAELNLMVPLLQLLRGKFEEAAASIEAVAESPERDQRNRLLALIQHALGLQAESDATLARLIAETNPPWNAFYAAEVHAWRGEASAALEWLSRIDLDEISPLGRYFISAYYSPFLAKLEGTPEWDDYRSGLLQIMRSDWDVDPNSSDEESSGSAWTGDSASACG
jgi:adenylate cyclase